MGRLQAKRFPKLGDGLGSPIRLRIGLGQPEVEVRIPRLAVDPLLLLGDCYFEAFAGLIGPFQLY